MPESSTATLVVIALSAVLIAGFFVGSRLNRSRARVRANWLRAALRSTGAEPRFSPLGAFGFSATADGRGDAIRSVDAAVILLPREVPPLWLARVLTGVPDILTVRLTLATPPVVRGDVADTSTPYGRRAARRVPAGWQQARHDDALVASPDAAGLDALRQLASSMRASGIQPQIISIRRSEPHLLVTLACPDSEDGMVAAIAATSALAERLIHPSATASHDPTPRATGAPGAARQQP